VVTVPLLEGTDGVRKMSKSFGNYIGIEEPPSEMFGKVMSISDDLMLRYYELLTVEPLDRVRATHPMEAKLRLAALLVERFHGLRLADEAREGFDRRIRRREFSEAGEVDLTVWSRGLTEDPLIVDVIHRAGLAASKSEIRRLIVSRAVDVDETHATDVSGRLGRGRSYQIRVGKRRLARVVI